MSEWYDKTVQQKTTVLNIKSSIVKKDSKLEKKKSRVTFEMVCVEEQRHWPYSVVSGAEKEVGSMLSGSL